MPRYYFHTEDGHRFNDDDGTELPDLQAARQAALRFIAELALSHTEEFWRDECLRVIVADDEGLTLFSLALMATNAAATSAARQRTG